MSSSKVGSRRRNGYDPDASVWPITVSPCQSRRIRPVKSSICCVVMRGMPNASNIGAMPRPIPSTNRPPVSRCIVVAYDAVTIGWRVLWLVAPVMIVMFVEATAAAPERVTASLTLKRSLMNTAPSPSASASWISVTRSRGFWAPPANV